MHFHIGRTPATPPTMMAILVAGPSFPPSYIGANHTSIPKDDEVWVLQAPRSISDKISTTTLHGTHHAVATSIGKFPFLPPNNHRHEQHCSTMTAPEPSPLPNTLCCIHQTDDATSLDDSSFEMDKAFSPIICKCPFAFCRGTCPTAASLWKTPTAPLLRPTTAHSISPIDAAPPAHPTQLQPINLAVIRDQIWASMAKLDLFFPQLMQPTTMALTP